MTAKAIEGRIFTNASLGLCLFEEGYSLSLLGMFVPIRCRHREVHCDEIMEKWGFCLHERSLHLSWAHHTKVIEFPWAWSHVKHEVLRPDGTWVPFVGSWQGDKQPDGRKEEVFDYTYTLENGTVQKRSATVFVQRQEWRWKWLAWCPWISRKSQCIDVEFDDEVGERTGSWKGGTTGCGYEMLPGETPEQALRRMERERIFN